MLIFVFFSFNLWNKIFWRRLKNFLSSKLEPHPPSQIKGELDAVSQNIKTVSTGGREEEASKYKFVLPV